MGKTLSAPILIVIFSVFFVLWKAEPVRATVVSEKEPTIGQKLLLLGGIGVVAGNVVSLVSNSVALHRGEQRTAGGLFSVSTGAVTMGFGIILFAEERNRAAGLPFLLTGALNVAVGTTTLLTANSRVKHEVVGSRLGSGTRMGIVISF